jgi:hypothetical protein
MQRQTSSESIMARGNILVLPEESRNQGIRFMHMTADHPASARVIAHVTDPITLCRKQVIEIRESPGVIGQFGDEPPANLRLHGVSETATVQSSTIWNGYKYEHFGDERNKLPLVSTRQSTAPNTTMMLSTPATTDPKSVGIAAWRTQVDPTADPTIKPEAPVEPTHPRPRRYVRADSDDEDDEEEDSNPRARPQELVTFGSPDSPPPPSTLLAWDEEQESRVSGTSALMAGTGSWENRATNATPMNMSSPDDEDFLRELEGSTTQSQSNASDATLVEAQRSVMAMSNISLDSRRSQQVSPDRNGTLDRNLNPTTGHVRPSFNPSAYGPNRRGRGHVPFARGAANFQAESTRGNRGGRAVSSAGVGTSVRGSGMRRGSQSSATATQAREQPLIDTSTPNQRTHPRIPPGFEGQVPLVQGFTPHATTQTAQNNMNVPVQTPSTVSVAPSRGGVHSSGSVAGSRAQFDRTGANYVTTFIPKPDIAALTADAIRKAEEARANNKKAAAGKQPPLHSTMNQQGKNPGKTPLRQETKAEKNARIAKAMEEAYGPASQAGQTPASSNSETSAGDKEQPTQKQSTLTRQFAGLAEGWPIESYANKLIPQLASLFEMARAFPGSLSFDIPFGQAIISQGSSEMTDAKTYPIAKWLPYVEGKDGKTSLSASFTRIITTNGADIDRALKTKLPQGTRMWSSEPGPTSVTYEFSCRTKANEIFSIVVDQKGNHELRKRLVVVGTVNLLVPTQIWDASAVLTGTLPWSNPPAMLAESAATFVKSLYVEPNRETLMIYFRQPSNQEMKIQNLIVKRTSYHQCNAPGCEALQLKVTEVKSLVFKVDPNDKKLCLGYENKLDTHVKLMREGRIYYEMSLVNSDMNAVLAKNASLEMGELTDQASTGATPVDQKAIQSMLHVAVEMVTKLDYMGLTNIGTQRRYHMELAEKRRQTEQTLGPMAMSRLPKTIGQQSVREPGSNMHSDDSSETPILVHGVRAGTSGDIHERPDGSRYVVGMGGAKVPVIEDNLLNTSRFSGSIVPDDSASQFGRPTVAPRYQSKGQDFKKDRGPNFW